MHRRFVPYAFAALLLADSAALHAQQQFTRADTLRGSYTTTQRAWWDVVHYDLQVALSPRDSSIRGSNAITYRVLQPARELQVDLMTPLVIDSVKQRGRKLTVRSEAPAYFVTLADAQRSGALETIVVYYHGRPKISRRPPWEAGFTWTTDSLGRPWIATTVQGAGASAWWPNKDTQADEPDSQRVVVTVPDPLMHVGNGRLRSTKRNTNGTTSYEWFSSKPINNYAIAIAAGNYTHWRETYMGEQGALTMDFYPIDYNEARARKQFAQAKSMMQCFEHWFGPYPWYEDGYKLIEVPNTGMEHQTAVTYGNWYENGYRRRDDSGTGLGLLWDFIIVHESAHEWFANNITAKDNADMWVHESFANYSENLYTECLFGKDAGSRYAIGTRRGIRNDRPIVPAYGVNAQGSGDMYPKGGQMLHNMRQQLDNDEKWRSILRGLNSTFRHQTVTGAQIEAYMSKEAGIDFTKQFDQYLRTTMIPEFQYRIVADTLHYRWANVVPGFDMPVRATVNWPQMMWLRPTTEWKQVPIRLANPDVFRVDDNFYVTVKRVP